MTRAIPSRKKVPGLVLLRGSYAGQDFVDQRMFSRKRAEDYLLSPVCLYRVSCLLVFFFAEFDQNPIGGFWVQEGDIGLVRTRSGLFIDQADTVCFDIFQSLWKIVHSKGQMLDAFPFLFDEFGNRAILGSGLQEFYPGIATGQEGHAHFLGRNFFDRLQLQAQLFVKSYAFFQVFHCDADVGDLLYHLLLLSTVVFGQLKAQFHRLNIQIHKRGFDGKRDRGCQRGITHYASDFGQKSHREHVCGNCRA